MKKIYFIIFFIIPIINIQANSQKIGKIGINIYNPKNTLHIGGDARIEKIVENNNPSYFLVTNTKGEIQKLKTDSFATYGTIKISAIGKQKNIKYENKNFIHKITFDQIHTNTNELLYDTKENVFKINKKGFYNINIKLNIKKVNKKTPALLVYLKNDKIIYKKEKFLYNHNSINMKNQLDAINDFNKDKKKTLSYQSNIDTLYFSGLSTEYCNKNDKIEFIIVAKDSIYIDEINLVFMYLGNPPTMK